MKPAPQRSILDDPNLLAAIREVYSRVPEQTDQRRYFYGGGDGSIMVAFEPETAQLIPPGGSTVGETGLVVRAMIGYVRKGKPPSTSPSDR